MFRNILEALRNFPALSEIFTTPSLNDVFPYVYQVPELNWKEVISCLDHPGFLISTVEALRLIVTACHNGLQEIFPIELLYRSWSNTEGQVSYRYV